MFRCYYIYWVSIVSVYSVTLCLYVVCCVLFNDVQMYYKLIKFLFCSVLLFLGEKNYTNSPGLILEWYVLGVYRTIVTSLLNRYDTLWLSCLYRDMLNLLSFFCPRFRSVKGVICFNSNRYTCAYLKYLTQKMVN